MSAYQKSTLILQVEPWTLCSEADEESEHTEGEISRREDLMTRCDRHVLSLPAKTASHEIRDFARPSEESTFQMQSFTGCEVVSILQRKKFPLSKRYTQVSRIYLLQLGPQLM